MTHKDEVVIYQTKESAIALRYDFRDGTVWASLDQIAHIFDRDKSTISRHLSKIFTEGELDRDGVVAKNSTTAKNAIVQTEGSRIVTREID